MTVPHQELERTLPGCEIHADSEDQDDEGDAEEVSDATDDWNCSAHLDAGHEFDVTLHLAPELVMVEINS